ncbi:MAG: RusA family crossover junction endodeoxyribonuclease [Myxococcota bacterium]
MVPGRPVSWKRAGQGSRGQRRTEGSMRIAAQRVRIVARSAVPADWNPSGRFRLEVESHYTGGVQVIELDKPHQGARSEGDVDNLEKLIADALQSPTGELDGGGRAPWLDDRQIVDGRSLKRYGQSVDQVVVRVWRVREAGSSAACCPEVDSDGQEVT